MKYRATIGLEIHAELATSSKMFCGCKNAPFEGRPNTYVCPVCLGLPGALPVPNQKAIIMTLILGKALNCQISENAKFDRKHYFYPDLPKGYQISQFDLPFCRKGWLKVAGKKIVITRIHLEEDTGKLLHLSQTADSLVDLNRAGVPLVELVTEPMIKSGADARAFAKDLRQILVALRISRANLEKGEMRIEANISLSSKKKLGTKVEVKNLNSFQSVERAIDYEIARQNKLLKRGEKIIQETRGFNQRTGKTFSQRTKESAADYRYFPEPDIPPFAMSGLEKLAEKLWSKSRKLLPSERVKQFTHLGLSKVWLDILIKDKKKLALAYKIINLRAEDKLSYGAIGLLVNRPQAILFSAKELLEIAKLPGHLQKRALSGMDTKLSSDINLSAIVKAVVADNSSAVSDYRSGKKQALKFLLGKAMAKSKGQADPKQAKKLLLSVLSGTE